MIFNSHLPLAIFDLYEETNTYYIFCQQHHCRKRAIVKLRPYRLQPGWRVYHPEFWFIQCWYRATAKFEFPIAPLFSISITGNITSVFYHNSILNQYGDSGADVFVPIKAGLKYYPISTLYIEGEGGGALELNHQQRHLGAFGVGPGFIIPQRKGAFDISFRYEAWSAQVKQTVLRFAYRFGL